MNFTRQKEGLPSHGCAGRRGHAEMLPQMVEGVLHWAGIDPAVLAGLAVSIGPGAFTGLRISVALAQGLAYGWGVPVVAVSTLAASAFSVLSMDSVLNTPTATGVHQAVQQAQSVLVALDARMGELYCGLYTLSPAVELDLGRVTLLPQMPEAVMRPDALLDKPLVEFHADQHANQTVSSLILTGSGFLGAERDVLGQLGHAWGISTRFRSSSLNALSVLGVALTQPQLAKVTDPASLELVYLRHAVAVPPKRMNTETRPIS
ncbi:MAG: tRNA (adenosine(37)-N6)-threonylcarbamoyltransferase complex dimerization subunit type 1 TsaB [Gammaproteobacteria bacterium]